MMMALFGLLQGASEPAGENVTVNILTTTATSSVSFLFCVSKAAYHESICVLTNAALLRLFISENKTFLEAF